jgi:RNA methyltransferase, TrmH family
MTPGRFSLTLWSKMITSVHNPRVQSVRRLVTQAKARREQGEFVIEGVRLAEEAFQADCEVRLVLFTEKLDSRGWAVQNSFTARGVPTEQVSDAVMHTVSQTETPQGILAVLAIRPMPLPNSPHFLLILDAIRDPGNMGTILRTATAAGVQGVLLAPGCVDVWSPKVVRAGMGAHFRLPIISMDWPELERFLIHSASSLHVFLADSSAGIPYTRADFRSPLALIVGGEAAGAGSESFSIAEDKVHIPMQGGSESLNAATAASILLFEVQRQRGQDLT